MAFKKGQSGNPAGRAKGSQNKLPMEVKQVIMDVAEKLGQDAGGSAVDALYDWAKKAKNQGAFWTQMFGKLIPKTVDGSGEDGAIIVRVENLAKAKKP